MSSLSRPTVYLDYNATTPLDPEVRAVMVASLDEAWGNPSSVHRLGRHARALLDEARERIAAVLRCKPGELTFTSGGTEANNLAILGTARHRRPFGSHLVCSAIEHPAVLHCFRHLALHEGFSLTVLPVDPSGRVDPDDLLAALRSDTTLVSVMTANNETGILEPVEELGRLCRDRGIPFHTDAVQWFGKVSCTDIGALGADLVSLCAHKLHGPKGSGVLYCRSPGTVRPLLFGGAHEYERRAGTENLPAILGLAAAVERFVATPAFDQSILAPWIRRLASVLDAIEGVQLHSAPESTLSNTLAFTVAGTDSISLLASLDLAGICASSGSACSVGSLEPSHVIQAMGIPRARAASLVRLSLGRENTQTEIDAVCAALPAAIRQATSP